jgi:hypothetical protein
MKACPHCGCDVVDAIKGAPRSPEQLRRYFAMLRAVHFNWPENHPRQFATVEELRAWVQMKAGHREVAGRMELGEDREHDMLLAEAMIRAVRSNALPVIHDNTLVVFAPKSIAFSKLAHRDFCRLNDEVDEVIRTETGLDPQQCLEEFKVIV